MLKKMTLLAMAVGALMAFAIPAVASADTWTHNGVSVGAKPGLTVDGTGELSATLGEFELGPCIVHFHGDIWNEPTGAGRVTSFTITPENIVEGKDLCQVWLVVEEETVATVCDIEQASANVPAEGWPITVGAETKISIGGANFTDKFNEGCKLGPGAGASGTATGVFSGGSIGFNNSGDLKAGEIPVFLDGAVSITPATTSGTISLHS